MNERKAVIKALVGSWNYNLGLKDDIILPNGKLIKKSDKDYKLFVLPNFEDLYTGKRFSSSIVTETEDIATHDVRQLVDLLYKSNVNFMEVLASTDLQVAEGNPEIEEIVSLKKEIFKMNLPYLFNAMYGMYKNKMSLVRKGTEGTQYLVDQFGYDTKQMLHAFRSLKFIIDFEATDFDDFEKAMKYFGADLDQMLELKYGFYSLEVAEKMVNHYHDSQFKHLREKYHSQPVNNELKAHLEGLVMSLIRRHITGGI